VARGKWLLDDFLKLALRCKVICWSNNMLSVGVILYLHNGKAQLSVSL
jgi:hypothetical protein